MEHGTYANSPCLGSLSHILLLCPDCVWNVWVVEKISVLLFLSVFLFFLSLFFPLSSNKDVLGRKKKKKSEKKKKKKKKKSSPAISAIPGLTLQKTSELQDWSMGAGDLEL